MIEIGIIIRKAGEEKPPIKETNLQHGMQQETEAITTIND